MSEEFNEAAQVAKNEATDNEERKPWLVVRVKQPTRVEPATDEVVDDGIEVYEPVGTDTFKVQVDADAWIKNNINEDEVLISVRRGKAFKAEVVRKVTEV